ncbi:MAG: hypothetical protein ACKVQB_10330 [Bacteroidia bacterium]
MTVPHQTFFGVDENGNAINYGFVREIIDEDRLIKLLKQRIQIFFVGQVEPLIKASPFPLSIMICIGIETLGEITVLANADDNGIQFKKILGKFNSGFSKRLTISQKELIRKNWPEKDTEKIQSLADLFYKYYRNTMIHGYRGKGVFLSSELDILYTFKDGFLVINPDLFWFRFKEIFDLVFDQLIKDRKNGSGERTRCLDYIRKLLE